MKAALALVLIAPLLAIPSSAAAHGAGTTEDYISTHPGPGRFALAGAPVMVDSADHAGVIRAADDLRNDIHKVTNAEARATNDPIILGTIGHSPILDKIIARGKLDVSKPHSPHGRSSTQVQSLVSGSISMRSA